MSDNSDAAAMAKPSLLQLVDKQQNQGESDASPSIEATSEIGHGSAGDPGASDSQESGTATKRSREDDGQTTASDFESKRQKMSNPSRSIMDKLKSETEQLIENPEEALGPDPIPPGVAGISTFHDNDVLSGRGGGTNVHPGNRNFRDLINLHRRLYLKARKNDKPAISRAIVRSIRNNNGRFLKKDEKSGLWYEIGDDAAREKTSQALRQRAPEMRKILFDTEREEARVATETQIRQQQQRMMMGMTVPQGGTGTFLPMPSAVQPVAMHPSMMYTPAAMAPMMLMNPALFMQPQAQQQQQQQQQQGNKAAAPGTAPSIQPTMQSMMMDPYQQAMFQSAFMTNQAMMMNPMMPIQQVAPFPMQQQPTNGNSAELSEGVNTSQEPNTIATLPAQVADASTPIEGTTNNETLNDDEEKVKAYEQEQAQAQGQPQDGVGEEMASGSSGECVAEI